MSVARRPANWQGLRLAFRGARFPRDRRNFGTDMGGRSLFLELPDYVRRIDEAELENIFPPGPDSVCRRSSQTPCASWCSVRAVNIR